MTNKDVLNILLCSYGYDRNIKIETYRGEGGCVGYDVYGENKSGDFYHEVCCEDFMFHVYMILNYMKEHNASYKSDWWSIRVKDICNDATRESLTKSWDSRDDYNLRWAIAYKPLQGWHEKNNPCPTCNINKRDHWDDVHYNCELFHTHQCKIMIEHYDKLREMTRQIKVIE